MGMMSTEQAAAAVHAAKMAQLNAMGLDKASQQHFLEKMQQQMQQNDLIMKRSDEIRRGDAEMVNHEHNRGKENDNGDSSGGEEDDYSEDDAEPEAVKAE